MTIDPFNYDGISKIVDELSKDELSDWISKLMEGCKTGSRNDVISVSYKYGELARSRKQEKYFKNMTDCNHRNDSKDFHSFVYLMFRNGSRHYKIGISGDVEKRKKQIEQHFWPEKVSLSVVHKIYCDNAMELERRLHKKFSSRRVSGEWFTLEEPDINFIKKIPFIQTGPVPDLE